MPRILVASFFRTRCIMTMYTYSHIVAINVADVEFHIYNSTCTFHLVYVPIYTVKHVKQSQKG